MDRYNGTKGPNVLGKDFHSFSIDSNGSLVPDALNYSPDSVIKHCPDNLSSYTGSSCGIRILRGDYGKAY